MNNLYQQWGYTESPSITQRGQLGVTSKEIGLCFMFAGTEKEFPEIVALSAAAITHM